MLLRALQPANPDDVAFLALDDVLADPHLVRYVRGWVAGVTAA
jgi:hypothetical protein